MALKFGLRARWIALMVYVILGGLSCEPTAENGIPSRGNITRRHIIVATVISPPFMMQTEVNGTLQWQGYCMDFFHELIKLLPYEVSYEIYQVADNHFGSRSRKQVKTFNKTTKQTHYLSHERWNGLVGELERKKAHLALAPLAVMAERELAIDFTVPFYDLVGIQILLKRPEVPHDWFKFLTVLDGEVWLSITVAYFVTSFVMFLFDRLSPYSHKNMARIRKVRDLELNRAQNVADRRPSRPTDRNRSPHRPPTNVVATLASSAGAWTAPQAVPPVAEQLGHRRPSKMFEHRRSLFLTNGASLNWFNQGDPRGQLAGGGGGRRRDSGNLLGDYLRRLSNFRPSLSHWPPPRFGQRELGDELGASDSDDDGRPDFNLRDSLWFCITSLTPQGGGEAPQNLSGRVVAGAWWLFCFIIIASYTANLAAFLTVSRLDIPIESLDDLAKQYRIKYAPVDGTAEQTYFERMAYIEEIFYNIWRDISLNDSLSDEERSKFAVWDYPISDRYTKIWSQIKQVGMPKDMVSAIERVKTSTLDDGFALLADANTVKYAAMTDCSLKSIGDEFSRKPVALGVQKGDTALRDDLSYATLKLINQRFMEILREKWWTNNPDRVICDNNDESEGIGVENIGGVFVIIFGGVIVSFLVWALEKMVYKTKIELASETLANENSLTAMSPATLNHLSPRS